MTCKWQSDYLTGKSLEQLEQAKPPFQICFKIKSQWLKVKIKLYVWED